MRLVHLTLPLLLVTASGCIEEEYPGDPVGSFDVTGALLDNSCGEAVTTLPTFDFPVELRNDRGQAFWRRADTPIVSGVVQDETYRFSARNTVPVIEPDPLTAHPGCWIEVTETIEVSVSARVDDEGDPEAPPEDEPSADDDDAAQVPAMRLDGSHVIDYAPGVGSSCAALLLTFGGPFREMPCHVAYDLSGSARSPF